LGDEALLSYPNSPESAQNFIRNLNHTSDKSVTLKIFQCVSCGLVQHDLKPVSYYKKVIRAVSFSDEMSQFRLKQLRDWVERYSLLDKSILEVGSGRGEYLDLFKEIGVNNIFGLEFDKNNVLAISEKGNVATCGYLDSRLDQITGAPFDAFAIFSFMEHWPKPKLSLDILKKYLSPNASGLVEVPNFEMIKKKGLYTEFTVDHIFYYDTKTLTNFLNANGFEVQAMNYIWNDYIISAEIIRRPSLDVDGFRQKFSVISEQVNSYLDSKYGTKRIIWGAGHQALTVISLTKIKSKVDYLVDSATFKQNKYTPESHLMINSPEYLMTDKPETALIMAAGFSDEIFKIITKNYPFIKNIAILREDKVEIVK
jgi:2-polyprenyl-3-methyl-5-hydroxy-6-metoxy-1,4-benzoquinol methylase